MKSLENKLGWLDAYYAGCRRKKINFNGHNFTNEVRKLEVRYVFFSSLFIFLTKGRVQLKKKSVEFSTFFFAKNQ